MRELLPDLKDDVLESYEEHHLADVLVVELGVDMLEAKKRAPRRPSQPSALKKAIPSSRDRHLASAEGFDRRPHESTARTSS